MPLSLNAFPPIGRPAQQPVRFSGGFQPDKDYAEALVYSSLIGNGLSQFDMAIALYDTTSAWQRLKLRLTPEKKRQVPPTLVEACKWFHIAKATKADTGEYNLDHWLGVTEKTIGKKATQEARRLAKLWLLEHH